LIQKLYPNAISMSAISPSTNRSGFIGGLVLSRAERRPLS
jgi:hypothetical protein